MTKHCPSCTTDLPKSEFASNKRRKDGLQSWCRTCVKTYNQQYYVNTPERNEQRLEWRTKNRTSAREYVANYLSEHPCVDCGESDIVVLEFDHLRDKEFTISKAITCGMTLERLKTEIAKCEVRCANDHRRVTAIRAGWWKVSPR